MRADTEPEIGPTVAAIVAARERVPRARSVLVAVSGMDGCGKGYTTARIVAALRNAGLRAEGLNVDAWLNLPRLRFNAANPAEHFYRNAIRFDDMFAQLVLPLRDRRSIDIEFDFAAEPATEYTRARAVYEDVDVIVLEGIYLLKREHLAHYDLTVWIEVSFATALARAIARGQEGLPPAETIAAYETTFFPAQRLHFARDDPLHTADLVIDNDR